MMAALDEYGYVVIRGVATPERASEIRSKFFDWFEALSPAIRRDDPSTFVGANLPIHARGLIQHYGVAWQPHAYAARAVAAPVFAELWGVAEEELWTSFDGTSATRKPNRCRHADLAAWNAHKWSDGPRGTPVHVDQTTLGFSSVQGGLAVTDQLEDQHCFVCVPGSHKYHEKLLSLGDPISRPHWQKTNAAQKEWLRSRGLDMIRVPMSAGDFVLWDSRTVHSSAAYCGTADPSAVRVQVFACMAPSPSDPTVRATEKKKRARYLAEGRASAHSPWPVRPFPKKPRTWGKSQDHLFEPPPFAMTETERRLHGVDAESAA